jgi:quercetin dioxygenase-like cupin family protein
MCVCGKFISSAGAEREQLDWGELGWFSRPATTKARDLVVIEVTLKPGFGHNFHKHPHQEESIYVITGEVEQWLSTEREVLRSGDSVFIPPDTVHASFNTGDQPVKLLVTLGPCIGEAGYEVVDVSATHPWSTIRSPVSDEESRRGGQQL